MKNLYHISTVCILCFLVISPIQAQHKQHTTGIHKTHNITHSLSTKNPQLAPGLYWRKDIYTSIHPPICKAEKKTHLIHKDTQTNKHSPSTYLSAEQILQQSQIRKNHPTSSFAIISYSSHQALKQLPALAQQTAKQHHHLGVAWGICPSFAWLITTPAPKAMDDPQLDTLLQKHCLSYSVKQTPPKNISFQKMSQFLTWWHKAMSKKNTFSALSLICQSKTPSWIGPQTWYTIQGHLIDPLQKPLQKLKESSLSFTPQQLLGVINSLRKQQHLTTITLAPASFHLLSHSLINHQTLIHNHTALQALAQKTAKTHSTLLSLSEIRLKASTPFDAISKIIHSPSHRSALMRQYAKNIAILIQDPLKGTHDYFVLMVLQNHKASPSSPH
ncbi:MAG: hypothetical protein OXC44_05005 [Proteobacteria bacterium]|nr:hypothetical protein [Pseudomonadota bacterium]